MGISTKHRNPINDGNVNKYAALSSFLFHFLLYLFFCSILYSPYFQEKSKGRPESALHVLLNCTFNFSLCVIQRCLRLFCT